MSAHDRHLTAYRSYPTQAFCRNPECGQHGEPVTVLYEEENGIGRLYPEECQSCEGNLDLDMPPEPL